MNRAAKMISAVAMVTYPLLVYFGLKLFSLPTVSGILVLLALFRLVAAREYQKNFLLETQGAFLAMMLICTAIYTLLREDAHGYRYYPVIVNLVLCLTFFASLFSGMPVAEKIARLNEPNLHQEAVDYTRKVTLAWGLFFIFNGSVALYTALFSSLDTWAIYNGFVSYLLIGTMFMLEWLARKSVQRRKNENSH